MTDREPGAVAPIFSEAAARRILTRAIELDHARAGSMSLFDMRAIAAEIGVSEDALLSAVREAQDLERARAAMAAMPARPGAKTLVALSMTSAMAGAATVVEVAASQTAVFPLALAAMLMLSGGVALFERRTRLRSAVIAFVAKNSTAWLSFGATWAVINALAPAQTGLLAIGPAAIASMTASVWAFSTLIGSTAAFWRSGAIATGAPGDGPARPRLRRRIATRLKAWIDVVLSRSGIDPMRPVTARGR